jgi:hypothetical protein
MFATSNPDDEDRSAGEGMQAAALFGYAALLLADAELLGAAMQGTIGANVQAIGELDFYAQRSETLISGAPVIYDPARPERTTGQLRAKDLIAELHAINLQIHKIMFQVERAVSRLATSG